MSMHKGWSAYKKKMRDKKAKKRKTQGVNLQDWQKRWHNAGPINFAEKLLSCPIDVPSHPDYNPDNNPIINHLKDSFYKSEDCPFGDKHPKFWEGKKIAGIPYHIILSEDQKKFLTDIWKNDIDLSLVAAARGAGKTFTLGVWDCWNITTKDKYSITCMGGSSKQSELIQKYIEDWSIDIPILRKIIIKIRKGIKRDCVTKGGSRCDFPACSVLSARGPHVNEVQIDEACFSPDSIIWVPNGFDRIDSTPKKLLMGKIKKYFIRNYNGEMINIKPMYYPIGYAVTPEHPIWAIKRKEKYWFDKEKRFMPSKIEYYKIRYSKNRDGNKKEAEWIKAEDLRKNDILVSPKPKRIINYKRFRATPPEFFRLIGYYIAEGSLGEHQTFLSFNSNERELIDDVKNIVKFLFNVSVHEYKFKDSNCINVYWTYKPFRKWAKDCGNGAKNKHIPELLMKLPNYQLDELLKGIYLGDGYKTENIKSLHIASKKLVYQILFIENSRGNIVSLSKEKDRDCFYLRKYNNVKYGWSDGENLYIPIYEIQKQNYNGKVYNFETDTHKYSMPYMLVHNCAAEDKSKDGMDAVAAVQWQTTGKRGGKVILTSTAHFIHGKFYEYMKEPKKYGFKTYRWAITKHKSGETDAFKVYTDRDPNNWLPNVWWLTNEEIHKKRRSKSDEEWLCEALGGASLASGAVFKKDDLDVCICNLCDNCVPYDWEKCKLTKVLQLGTPDDPTKFIIERRAGWDYGVSDAPCALTIIGRKKNVVFVLYNDEQLGIREEEKIDWISREMNRLKANVFIPDPAVAGKHLNEKLDDKGYAVYIIAEQEKLRRVFNVINFVEKHKIIIPKAFWYITQSLRKLAWKDPAKKLRKLDDHSFDSLQYGICDWQVEEGGSILDEFLKGVSSKGKDKVDMPTIDGVYGTDKEGKEGKRSLPRIEDLY